MKAYVKLISVLPAMLISGLAPAYSEDLDGQIVFNNNCRTCHSTNAGDNRLGPTLHNIVGRKAGAIDGYAFSSSMKSSGITWTEDNLRKFITNPESVVPGNQMQPFGGMKSEEEKTALIKFLASAK